MNEQEQNTAGTSVDSISAAQADLRKSYADGSLGVLVSGTVWMAAALVALYVTSQIAVWTLFFGGMLIHPLGLLLAKLIGVPTSHSPNNALGKLALEGTIFMLMCIPLALLLSLQNHAWFFQGMLLIIGGRYLTFTTLYGIKTYWVLGGMLGAASFVLFILKASPAVSALSGSIIEIGFGSFMFFSYKKSKPQRTDDLEKIRQYFESEFGISRADWEIFSSKLNRHEFPKKSKLVEAGKVENHLSFIEKGIVRLYIPKEDGDLTFGFVFNGAFVSAYDSFLTQKPSEYTVETITDTTLWRLGHKELQEVYASSSIGNLIGRRASEELFLKKSKRELSLLRDSAEQRYLNLFEERPELLREIPLKYIASYIGVTPQALSRIRRRIS